MYNALNLSEFPPKLELELFLILPLIKDIIFTMDRQLIPKCVLSLEVPLKIHNNLLCVFPKTNISGIMQFID